MTLDVRFLVPGAAAATLIRTRDGAPPSAIPEGDEAIAAIVPVDAFLREAPRFTAAALETHPATGSGGRWSPPPRTR